MEISRKILLLLLTLIGALWASSSSVLFTRGIPWRISESVFQHDT